MALSDFFYPGNPEKRRTVVRLSERLATLMESNFKRTNDLIDCIHTYIPGRRFSKVRVNRDTDVRTNCRVINERIRQIQNYVEEKALYLKRKIDSNAYRHIMSVDTTFIEKFRYARNVARVCDLVLSVAAIAIVGFIKCGTILTAITVSTGTIMTCGLAGVLFGALILGFDAIFGLISGAIEKDKLKKTISELKSILREFEPASDKFDKGIQRMIIAIEDQF